MTTSRAVIFASHIEAPRSPFLVRFFHRSYRPDGFPFSFPSDERIVEVRAETPEGALAIARYHYSRFGSAFRIEAPASAGTR